MDTAIQMEYQDYFSAGKKFEVKVWCIYVKGKYALWNPVLKLC